MFAASPGLHGIEHAVYDAWLTDCKGGKTIIPDEIARAPETVEPTAAPPPPNANRPRRQPAQQAQPGQPANPASSSNNPVRSSARRISAARLRLAPRPAARVRPATFRKASSSNSSSAARRSSSSTQRTSRRRLRRRAGVRSACSRRLN